ncbi:multicopper oxidase domain-containing protein [Arthrobacter sp. NEB 688]|uniref:multicopper oxidase domain-containing protein n=1 Tax=Arthrobacter sp. NEB 688 TaxID=904039 RepID=UPI0015679FB6|nr:multicopper oxidase domain-containing protein [Arthrobacter sp. NEB 688]QKE83925.1 multicopper oxidase domain-containing protein [Arthrobacter sp. NEB 688]
MTKHLRTAALSTLGGGALVALGLLFGPVGTASAADVDIHLEATSGTTSLPSKSGPVTVPVWGYCVRPDAGTACGPLERPGGPTLTVDEGDHVTITLHDALTERTSLLLGGQQMVPDTQGAAAGGERTYTFTASRPGTYLYQAGPTGNFQHQVAMGLYGALVVRPATAGRAYDDAASAYDTDQVLVVGELDPALNTANDPAAFDMRKFSAAYELVNGRVHPDTQPVVAASGQEVLLRWVNAGVGYHSMAVLGADQRVIAYDGSRLLNDGGALDISRSLVADTFGPGQTADAIVHVPTTTTDRRLAVYDAGLGLHSGTAAKAGGALTFIEVAASGAAVDNTGPVTSGARWDAGSLSADVSDETTGGGTVEAVEYLVDTTVGSGTAMTGTFGTSPVHVTAAYDVPAGPHVLYVHGRDADGAWGPWSSVLVQGSDTVGPSTTGLELTPDHTNGAAAVALSATGNDSATGNHEIAAAEWSVDGGAASPMTVATSGPVASLTATIPAGALSGLADGLHTVGVRSRDSAGAWGPVSGVQLAVDRAAPVASGLSLSPNPNNGTLAISSTTPAVRLVATLTDEMTGDGAGFDPVQSVVDRGEVFLDTVGPTGSGIPVEASDGAFSTSTENVYLDIPLATVRQLSAGTHKVWVRGHDAAGSWATPVSVDLVIDKTAPTLAAFSVSANPTAGATRVTVTGGAGTIGADPSGFGLVEVFAGADPGVGKGTAVSRNADGSFSATLPVDRVAEGATTVRLRVRDGAGNTATRSAPLTVTHPLWFTTNPAVAPTGVPAPARTTDVFRWDGAAASKGYQLSTLGVPATADVDGFARVDATHFYVSFSNPSVTVTGLGAVNPREVIYRDGTTWRRWFNGASAGIVATANVDAIDVVGSWPSPTLYASVSTFAVPGGAATGGTGSPSDVYRWNGGNAWTRVVDASTIGIPDAANTDGFVWLGADDWAFSFAATTTRVTGLTALVADEDVVRRTAGTWSTYFDGSTHGLGGTNVDVDAVDLP